MNRLLLCIIFSGAIVIAVALGLWMYVLIAICVGIVLGVYIGYLTDSERRVFKNIKNSGMSPRQKTNSKEQQMSDTIENEWNEKSIFGNAEDLK